jgi:type II secretory pathway component PulC
MKRDLALANVALLATALLIGRQLKGQWIQFGAENNLQALEAKKEQAPAGTKASAQSREVSNYGAIVESLLFSPDRNSVVVADPAAVVAERPKAKPVLTGIVGLGAYDIALMLPAEARDNSEYRRLKVGDSISGYTLVKCLDQKVLMSLDGKEVEIPISEPKHLVAREAAPVTTGTAGPKSERVTTLGAAPEAQNPTQPSAQPAATQVPIGTVRQGKVLKSFPTPFGPMNLWVDEK